ncbi:YdcF family protein [Conservatibacter flavescens]|uniref:DUF218 domain-containing protein n=1 Tax=Conservatibacter flavescens TaxID=28161 RepID=A0A2M8S247_9PAST|nr:YdcF family protein [Conservatibacter flavescens]PJG85222.1 hypothetical protein CVP05_08165 [Conservatibacter flavescens]
MFELTRLISTLILPPANILILWLLSLLLLKLQYKKLSLFTALLSASLLYIVSIPYTTETLSKTLVHEDHLSIQDYRQAQAIVVLGAGLRDNKELYSSLTVPAIALERMRYAAYLYQETHLPLLVTGASPNGNSEAKVMAREFEQFFHTPVKWLEEQALNTKQNAVLSKKILEKSNINKIILVTNQWHMQRAKLLFEQQGFQVFPASVGQGLPPQSYGIKFMHFIPQSAALNANMQLLKEWIGYWKEK